MKVGLVSPYSWDVPGGVQLHVRDLAEFLLAHGHSVSVLAPADEDAVLPPYVVGAGRAVPVPYNGSVARLLFGPLTASRVSRWLEQEQCDVIHVHEPVSPSLSMLAMWAWEGPLVATFHTSTPRSRALLAAGPLLQPGLEKVSGRIAVSQDARRTVQAHIGGDAVVIPNGVYVHDFADASINPLWQGTPQRPTIAFLGRTEEPRKGLPVLLEALQQIQQALPGVRLLVAGPGDPSELLVGQPESVVRACEFLGRVSDEDKARLLRSVDAYVAPNTGGESFGIILIEAMSAGVPVIASDINAFRAVLDEGYFGELFANESASDLATVTINLLRDPTRRQQLSVAGRRRAQEFDWSRVAAEIVNVYETVIAATPSPVQHYDGRFARWRRGSS